MQRTVTDYQGKPAAKPILTDFADFSKRPDSDFDHLEPLETRKLINRAFRAHDNPSHSIASILLQIRYLDQEYTFNIRLYHAR
ncbi:MAG: hypothetical protein PVG35_10560 [Desulfobacterales bacterium]